MVNLPCPNANHCDDPSIPVGNYSSETPEFPTFVAVGYPIINPNDPIDGSVSFQATGCVSVCESTISQQDADLCAARQAFVCSTTPPPGTTGPSYFYSSQQSYAAHCPDGGTYTYTVAAGAFVSLTQAGADAQALAYAQLAAGTYLLCFSGTIPAGCAGSTYEATITPTQTNSGPYQFQVVSGTLPPGLSLSFSGSGSATISGTPTTTGSYAFTVRITDALGNYADRTITLCISGPQQSSLPDGKKGTAYSQTLTAPSCSQTPLSWQIVSGTLPPGLVLDEATGVISGTPTSEGTFAFTVSLQTGAT